MAQGEVDDDGTIEALGMKFSIGDGKTGQNRAVTITMDKPQKGNILNELTTYIDSLRDGTLSTDQLSDVMAQAQVSVKNAMNQYDMYRGRVGSRENEVENVINSDTSLKNIKTTARANITEVDAFEAASDIVKDQQALQVARSVFSSINGTSLFDYI